MAPFKHGNPGDCPCCFKPCRICIDIQVCPGSGIDAPHMVLTLFDDFGNQVDQCGWTGPGVVSSCCVLAPTVGFYSLTLVPDSGFHVVGFTFTDVQVRLSDSGGTLNLLGWQGFEGSYNLESGFSCLPNSCCPVTEQIDGTSPPFKVETVPSTLVLNDGTSDVILTFNAGAHAWIGAASRNSLLVDCCCPSGIPLENQDITLAYSFACVLGCSDYHDTSCRATWVLIISVPGCTGFFGCGTLYPANGDCQAGTALAGGSILSCKPFSWNGSIGDIPGEPIYYLYPGGATFTVKS